MNNTLIDNLSYSYYSNGNRLKSVNDASGNTAGYAPNSGQYLYDANANMTYDPSKKITVSYNPLNLPSLVEFDNSDFIEYTYTATGTKLRKTVTSWKTTTGGTTDYAGQFLYQDNELSCIFTPVGRIVPMQYNDETFWKHEYNLKDHLGNTRIVFAAHPHGQPEVMQQTSYYPFGMTLQQQNFGGALNQPNKLLYNGKELQDDELAGVSLDWYDYGVRMYDPALGRWHCVDPMADQRCWVSPYNYLQNNPINRIDPTGALDEPVYGSDGTYRGNTKEGFTGEVIIYDGDKDFSTMSANELLYNESFDFATQQGDANTYDRVRGDLTGDAKSKIWTHIASKMEGQQIFDETFSMSSIEGGKIFYDGSDNGGWNSRPKSIYEGRNDRITGTDKYTYKTTVENIQSTVVVHEWYSHIKKGQGNYEYLKSHRLAYKNVINYKSLWNKTTDDYKGFNMRSLLKYTKDETGRTTVDPLYRNLYNKYKDKR